MSNSEAACSVKRTKKVNNMKKLILPHELKKLRENIKDMQRIYCKVKQKYNMIKKFNVELCKIKRETISSRLNGPDNINKTTWNIVNDIRNNKVNLTYDVEINIDYVTVRDSLLLSNKINNYFIIIGDPVIPKNSNIGNLRKLNFKEISQYKMKKLSVA